MCIRFSSSWLIKVMMLMLWWVKLSSLKLVSFRLGFRLGWCWG